MRERILTVPDIMLIAGMDGIRWMD